MFLEHEYSTTYNEQWTWDKQLKNYLVLLSDYLQRANKYYKIYKDWNIGILGYANICLFDVDVIAKNSYLRALQTEKC